jgi:hypothetical protein
MQLNVPLKAAYFEIFTLLGCSFWTGGSLKMGPISFPETSVANYLSTQWNIPHKRQILEITTADLINTLCM